MADNPELRLKLSQLEDELQDGEITQKGFEKRRTMLFDQYRNPYNPYVAAEEKPSSAYQQHPTHPPSHVARFQELQLGLKPGAPEYDRSSTMMSIDYRFNPPNQPGYDDESAEPSRLSTLVDSQQGYFSDFAGHQEGDHRDSYGGPQRYNEGFSPSANIPPPMLSAQDLPGVGGADYQVPLEPRDIPFDSFDPHNASVSMSKFDNIAAVLKHRSRNNARQTAYWVLDNKGKEIASITFEKLASRAEKVAQVIKDKSNLYRGDRVALVYRDHEIIDFAVALFGCFLAGVVAVPMNGVDDDFAKLQLLLTTTQAHLALTTEENLKKFQRDIANNRRLKWPSGVEWWKTNEFGGHHAKKKDEGPQLPSPDLAYIEFSRAPTGDLRGVVLSHRTVMHQMTCIQAMLSTIPVDGREKISAHRASSGGLIQAPKSSPETILSYLDPREGVGMILAVLLPVYGGHTSVYMSPTSVETPGLYAHLLTKYRTTIMLADYPGLMRAVYNYQSDPMSTRNYRNKEPNFSSVRICFIDTLTIDCEFQTVLADRWLKPLRNNRARELVAPILCLPEHGGMIISVRDWLGGEEQMGCSLSAPAEDEEREEEPPEPTTGYSGLIGGARVIKQSKPKSRTELSEVLLDKEALVQNEVRVLAVGAESERRANEPGTLRTGAFGFPIPDATLAVVDPETSLLCAPNSIGEIWVDSPSLSGGFWALPKHTETIFHARPYRFVEGNPNPILVEPEFLRTGLLGFVYEGKVFVLGLYEDRIRQRVDDQALIGLPDLDHRYYFVQHLVITIMKKVLKIYDCSAFESHVNGEYLPIIVLETQAASTAPTTAGGPPLQLDIPFLDSLSERVMDVLFTEHKLRIYCVMTTAPNTLPRIIKNGRREIGNMLCRKEFDTGSLGCVHVKFGVERAVTNLPIGDDPLGGIWSPLATQRRQGILMTLDKQWSGMDYREVVIDDKTSAPLNPFTNIHDLMQFRVARHPEELSYCTIDGRGREGKGVNWKKFDQKVAAVAIYLKNKAKVRPGDHILLMYTHSEDFVFAVHACICLGTVGIPMAPIDQNRLNEDAPALLHLIADFKIKAILVNNEVDSVLKQKTVSQHLRQSATILRVNIPPVYNTSKPSKQNHGCRELGLNIKPQWTQPTYPVIVWVYWTPDQRRIAVQLGHSTLMALCKVQKETCQMTSNRATIGCVRSTIGLGFVYTCLIGVYLAVPTYLVSPVDFALTPNVLFHTLSRYKIKDTYATSNMLDHAMANGAGKSTALVELKNLMITTETRPQVDVYQKVRVHFAQAGLDRTAINTVYSHVLNPMVTSRSYMSIEPIELWLDRMALRRGIIAPVHPESDPTALLVQDSGMVPVSTRVCVVNPESNALCLIGELGEIWVESDANVVSFYGSKDILDSERFNGRTVDGNRNIRYMRTGDLGFLHNVARPIGANGGLVDMQVLFVLGNIGETFEVNGLCHFPLDIEASVERSHRNIVPGGSAIFQAGGLAVVLVEVDRKQFLASLVPVIVNAVLNHHHFIVDIVAFVSRGDFPRSRLGEKQRGKILASWVTRKMRTIAQFAIRDPGAEDDAASARHRQSLGPRLSTGSGTVHSTGGGSTRSREIHRDSLPAELHSMSLIEPPQLPHSSQPTVLPQNELHVELPNTYPEQRFIPDAEPDFIPNIPEMSAGDYSDQSATPTGSRRTSNTIVANNTGKHRVYELGDNQISYSPVDYAGPFSQHDPATNSTTRPSEKPQPLRVSRDRSSQILAQAAQNLPGSLLPPAAIAEMRGEYHDYHSSEDESEHAPPLPSYVNKPYLSMLTEETGREGILPGSPTYGGGRRSRETSRPSSRSGEHNPIPPITSNTKPRALQTIHSQHEIPQMPYLGPHYQGEGMQRPLGVANPSTEFVGPADHNSDWSADALRQIGGIGLPPSTMPRRKDVGRR